MQTFLPYKDFEKTAQCLDYKRLGKQRVEAKQIYDLITGKTINRWKNHPAVLMWQNYTEILAIYHDIVVNEWIKRGYNNSMPLLFCHSLVNYNKFNYYSLPMPNWLGDENFHSSHRAALLAKNYEWYSQFGWKETPKIYYLWPFRKIITK